MPRVSVILPTYNGERHLSAQLDSILAQTFSDFELLIVDDGSTDGTIALIESYLARDRRLRRLPSDRNLGQNQRLAQLIEAANGDFISVADQDDVWEPDKTQALLEAIGDQSMVFGMSRLMDADGRDLGQTILDALGSTPEPALRLRALNTPMVSGHASLARADWLTTQALFSPARAFDWLWALEAIYSGGLVYTPKAVVHHRIHDQNLCNREILNRKPARRLSPWRIRTNLAFHLDERQRLWLALDYLGRSQVLDPKLKRAFLSVADNCRHNWFSPWRKLGPGDRALRRSIEDLLHPFAGSDEDWLQFSRNVQALTRAPWRPANLLEGLGRL